MLVIMMIITVVAGMGWRSSEQGGREDRCWQVAPSGRDTLLLVMGSYLLNLYDHALRRLLAPCCVI